MRQMIIIALTFMLSLPVTAQDFQEGMEAYQRNDYVATLREWRPLAEQGDALAQYNLGAMYNIGRGVAEDHAEALKWFRRAAKQGFAEAQFVLGNIYQGMGGIYANKDASDEDKIIAAMFRLYDYAGLGVPPNNTEAAKWYLKAADQGLIIAQHFICVSYQQGHGVPYDLVQAHMWCSLVERSGLRGSQEAVAGDLAMFVGQMTHEQISKAQRLAHEWLEKHGKAE